MLQRTKNYNNNYNNRRIRYTFLYVPICMCACKYICVCLADKTTWQCWFHNLLRPLTKVSLNTYRLVSSLYCFVGTNICMYFPLCHRLPTLTLCVNYYSFASILYSASQACLLANDCWLLVVAHDCQLPLFSADIVAINSFVCVCWYAVYHLLLFIVVVSGCLSSQVAHLTLKL